MTAWSSRLVFARRFLSQLLSSCSSSSSCPLTHLLCFGCIFLLFFLLSLLPILSPHDLLDLILFPSWDAEREEERPLNASRDFIPLSRQLQSMWMLLLTSYALNLSDIRSLFPLSFFSSSTTTVIAWFESLFSLPNHQLSKSTTLFPSHPLLWMSSPLFIILYCFLLVMMTLLTREMITVSCCVFLSPLSSFMFKSPSLSVWSRGQETTRDICVENVGKGRQKKKKKKDGWKRNFNVSQKVVSPTKVLLNIQVWRVCCLRNFHNHLSPCYGVYTTSNFSVYVVNV